MAGFLIGAVARHTGVSVPTIRYYERLGLVTAAPRSRAGYRRYDERAIDELRFIKKAQSLGFALEEIREILDLGRAGMVPCAHVLAVARHHLQTVDERLKQLASFRKRLAGEIANWEERDQATCEGLCQLIRDATEVPVEPRPKRNNPPSSRAQH